MSAWRGLDEGPERRAPGWQRFYWPAGVLVVPVELARRLARGVDLAPLRLASRMSDPALYELLVAIRAAEVLPDVVPTEVPPQVPAGSEGGCCESMGWGTAEVAARAGVSARSVTKAALGGRLPGRRGRGGWRFDPADVDEWIQRRAG